MDRDEGKALHDLLRSIKPETAECPPACPFCIASETTPPGGTVDFTAEQQAEIQRQIDAAVASATKSLTDQLSELRQQGQEAQLQAKIDEAVAQVAGEKADLQRQLDEAVAAKAAAEQTLADVEAYLASEDERMTAERERDARKDTRVGEVASVIEFPEDHVKANEDRWAALTDEEFAAQLEDYKVLAEAHGLKPKAPAPAGPPAGRSALTAKEERPAPTRTSKRVGAAAEVMHLRRRGIDVRDIA